MPGERKGNSNIRRGALSMALPSVEEYELGQAMMAMFPGGRRVYLNPANGNAVTAPGPIARADMIAHITGRKRWGLSPICRDGYCRWGAVDLDSKREDDPVRHGEARQLVAKLEALGIASYWKPSRGWKGAHVFIFFDDPGVPCRDLNRWLASLAEPYRLPGCGPVEVFPSRPGTGEDASSTRGNAIFLPYFGPEDDSLLDLSYRPQPVFYLQPNPVTVVPTLCAPDPVPPQQPYEEAWPPSCWGKRTAYGMPPNADQGNRNKVAGSVARQILRTGGTFEDFKAWDQGNRPPLASDEPGQLEAWWNWAVKKGT